MVIRVSSSSTRYSRYQYCGIISCSRTTSEYVYSVGLILHPHILIEILASIRVEAVELESAHRWPSGIYATNKWRLSAATTDSISSASTTIANDASGSGSDSPRFVRRSHTLLLFLIVRPCLYRRCTVLRPGLDNGPTATGTATHSCGSGLTFCGRPMGPTSTCTSAEIPDG
jgi:hypothetical protein